MSFVHSLHNLHSWQLNNCHVLLHLVSCFLHTSASIPCTWLRVCVKSCDSCFFLSLGILAKMLLTVVFLNWFAVMRWRSIFAVLVRWLGISWAVAAESVWSRQQCVIYFRWLMLGQCHNLHSLSSQHANFLDDISCVHSLHSFHTVICIVCIVCIVGSWTSARFRASCQLFPSHFCQYSMHLIESLCEVMW